MRLISNLRRRCEFAPDWLRTCVATDSCKTSCLHAMSQGQDEVPQDGARHAVCQVYAEIIAV
jgi:hypothetical protein